MDTNPDLNPSTLATEDVSGSNLATALQSKLSMKDSDPQGQLDSSAPLHPNTEISQSSEEAGFEIETFMFFCGKLVLECLSLY